MENYYRLAIQNFQSEEEDSLTYDLFAMGAEGVSEALDFTQPGKMYEPVFSEKEEKVLEAFFVNAPEKKLLDQLKEKYSGIVIQTSKEESKDWMEEWKKDFHAFELVSSIWLVPSWLEAPKEATKSIYIDPGMAFGTGTHDTTQLCSKALFSLMNDRDISSVIDVGCGTGILAILAEHLGANKIDATEIDETARECAKENVVKNKTQYVSVLDQQVDQINEAYDLVVANIIDGILISIKDDLVRLTKKGGYLVLSGILEERKADFETDFAIHDFKVISHSSQGEWLSYTLRKQ